MLGLQGRKARDGEAPHGDVVGALDEAQPAELILVEQRDCALVIDHVHLPKQLAELATLRYFGGLSVPEIATLRKVSESTVKRQWWLARAWLRSEIEGERLQ